MSLIVHNTFCPHIYQCAHIEGRLGGTNSITQSNNGALTNLGRKYGNVDTIDIPDGIYPDRRVLVGEDVTDYALRCSKITPNVTK